jgi:hypothetical protein
MAPGITTRRLLTAAALFWVSASIIVYFSVINPYSVFWALVFLVTSVAVMVKGFEGAVLALGWSMLAFVILVAAVSVSF